MALRGAAQRKGSDITDRLSLKSLPLIDDDSVVDTKATNRTKEVVMVCYQ